MEEIEKKKEKKDKKSFYIILIETILLVLLIFCFLFVFYQKNQEIETLQNQTNDLKKSLEKETDPDVLNEKIQVVNLGEKILEEPYVLSLLLNKEEEVNFDIQTKYQIALAMMQTNKDTKNVQKDGKVQTFYSDIFINQYMKELFGIKNFTNSKDYTKKAFCESTYDLSGQGLYEDCQNQKETIEIPEYTLELKDLQKKDQTFSLTYVITLKEEKKEYVQKTTCTLTFKKDGLSYVLSEIKNQKET